MKIPKPVRLPVPSHPGKFVLVDRDIPSKLKGKGVYLSLGYATIWVEPKNIRLHRWIMGVTDPEVYVDHRNRKILDCRRKNLRVATKSQNQFNRKLVCSLNKSGYRGVSFNPNANAWEAYIGFQGKRHHLGLFATAIAAAKARDTAAKKYHGNFANLNFP